MRTANDVRGRAIVLGGDHHLVVACGRLADRCADDSSGESAERFYAVTLRDRSYSGLELFEIEAGHGAERELAHARVGILEQAFDEVHGSRPADVADTRCRSGPLHDVG